MKTVLFSILFLFLVSFSSFSEENYQYTGNALFNGLDPYMNLSREIEVDIDTLIDIAWAQGYILGSWEMGLVQYGLFCDHPSKKALYCPPMDIAMPNSQLAKIVHSFLKQYPEHRNKGALELITIAYAHIFPCPE